MTTEKKYPIDPDLIFVILGMFILVGILIAGIFYPLCYDYDGEWRLEETYDLWDVDAPFGHYWVDLDGCVFSFDSTLVESYTCKYLVDGELKTLILPSTNRYVHVYLTENESMYLEVYHRWVKDPYTHHYEDTVSNDYILKAPRELDSHVEFRIYVPDPKLFEGGVS